MKLDRLHDHYQSLIGLPQAVALAFEQVCSLFVMIAT